MTESVVLLLLGVLAIGGVAWTLWDIGTELRRRKLK